jgi:hypothetical protein
VLWRHEQSRLTRHHDIADGVHRGSHHRYAADHGLYYRRRQSFIAARQCEDIKRRQYLRYILPLSRQDNAPGRVLGGQGTDTLGQLASPDPDADDVGSVQMIDHREEILGCLLVREASHGTDDRRAGRNAESTSGTLSGPRRVRRRIRRRRSVNSHTDGPDPIGRDQPPPDSFDRDPGPDTQRKVGDAAEAPFDGDVSAAPTA